MQPRKLSLMVAFFPYAGNSTGSSINDHICQWWGSLLVKLKTDKAYVDRVHRVVRFSKADTPITMVRNLAVKKAQEAGIDVLMMVDSDIHPDVLLGVDPAAVPFFDTAFNAIYDHWDKGPLVIGAPYGGCPPHENMFVFDWVALGNLGDESSFKVRQYERPEAQVLVGLHECAALPTGLIMYDMRAFNLISPPYFRYEWKDETESEKASTEDVTNTRDISLAGIVKLGYNPVMCAWSSWAGHRKVWTVSKPSKYTATHVAKTLRNAILAAVDDSEGLADLEHYIAEQERATPTLIGGAPPVRPLCETVIGEPLPAAAPGGDGRKANGKPAVGRRDGRSRAKAVRNGRR